MRLITIIPGSQLPKVLHVPGTFPLRRTFLFFSLFLTVLLSSLGAFAQTKVSGRILDDQTGDPVIGATIRVKGQSLGTTSDPQGNFSLNTPENSTLEISYVGFARQELKAGTNMEIRMKADAGLNEVVVIGYGTQRKSDLTGSVVSIKAADLTKIGGTSNPAEGLQSKAPGVQVLSSGSPGTSPIIRVRGVGSNSNPNPLFVVDGMILDDINFLTSNDIESMEVLKDASATAIYGARGANGVIIVTTKKGKAGSTIIDVSGSEGMQFLTRKYETANASEYGTIINKLQNTTVYPNPASLGKGTDWLKEVSRNASFRDYQIALNGGSEKIRYNLSGSYFRQDGVFRYTTFNRVTVRLNTEYKVNDKLTVGENMSMSNSNNAAPGLYYLFMRSVNRVSPLLSVYDSAGKFTAPQDGRLINPYASLFYNKDYNSNDVRLVGNFWGNYEVLPGLNFRTSYGVNWLHNRTDQFIPSYSIIQPNQYNPVNSYSNTYGVDFTWLWENTLTYDKQLGNDHHLNLLAGTTAQKRKRDYLTGTGKGYALDDLNYVSIYSAPASTRTVSGEQPLTETILSYLFRANYSYKDRYLLTGSFRIDGSSKFGKNNRFAQFPSIALGWRVTEEGFMKDNGVIDNLKLRASWGVTGNDKISNGISYALVTQDPVYDAIFNRAVATNGAVLTSSNPDIKWERTFQKDMGFEMSVLKNRLAMEFDYYNRETKDLLLIIPIAGGSAGINATYSNVGAVRNKGIEFALDWQDNIDAFKYGVRVTGSTFKNTVTDYGKQVTTNNIFSTPLFTRIQEGQPLGYFYGYQAIGIYRTQGELDEWNKYAVSKGQTTYHNGAQAGDLIYKDVNGDGRIDGNDMTNIGSPYPKFYGSLNLSASWKGFDFSVDLFGSFGSKILNGSYNLIEFNTTNLHKDWVNAWTPDNTNASMPRLGVNSINTLPSSFIVQSGSYVKVRNVEFGYTFNKLGTSKIKSARIFLNATNLFYITKYKGASPEITSADLLSQNVDLNPYPVSSNARAGVNVKF